MRFFLFLAIAWTATGADSSGPVLGYVYDDASKSIRPLLGSPGAASIGPAADEHRYDKAAVSGDKGIGIAFRSDESGLLRVAPGEEPEPIADASGRFDVAASSVAGSSAALFSKECACVQVVSALSERGRVLRTIGLGEGADVRALAVTDDGVSVAIGLASGKALLASGERTAEITADAVALAFSPDGERLAVGDDVRKSVVVYTNAADAPEPVYSVSERDGLDSPKAVWFSSDRKLLVADGSGFIHVVEPDAGAMRSVSCACIPDRYARTTSSEVLRITGTGSGTTWVLRSVEEGFETLFVPMVRNAGVAP